MTYVTAAASASGDLLVHFIDVGQGDSELVQFNGTNILIDGGTQEMGPVVESYLREHGVSSLDLVVATHPHEDHIGGLLAVLNDFPVGQVLDSGQAVCRICCNFIAALYPNIITPRPSLNTFYP